MTQAVLPARVAVWLDDPDGGGLFAGQRDLIRAHDPACPGLIDAWMGRKGGYSCISDSMTCDGCEIDFHWEGLQSAFDGCRWSRHWYCACCLAKATTCGCAADGSTP